MQRNCLGCGIALAGEGPVEIDTLDALDWTTRIAEASAAGTRNGPSRVRHARNAVMRLVEDGEAPDREEVDSIGWMFAMAERAARRYGSRVLAMVRTTARAIADLLDEVLSRHQRNLALELGGLRLEAPAWVSQLATVAGRVGLDVGAAALRSKLDSLGIGADMFGLVEEELNREGMSMGVLAHPPKLTTFASLQKKAA